MFIPRQRSGSYPGSQEVDSRETGDHDPFRYRTVISDLLQRITIRPEQCHGWPCICGMRIRVADILEMLALGMPEPEILRDFPYLVRDDIRACLVYAASLAGHPVVFASYLLHAQKASAEFMTNVEELPVQERDS
jgi:uncharacterized protein (DUF433 family)